MNTNRDNFHDWAKDKPDTAFSTISRADFMTPPPAPGIRWGRLALMAVIAVAIGVAIKYLAGH